MTDTIDIPTLRRYVVAHQGYGQRKRATIANVAGVIEQLGAVQLDSISAVERAHRLTISSRVGTYDRAIDNRLLAEGHAFEYWAHEACLVPMRDYPLMRRRMVELGEQHWWGRPRDRTHEGVILDRIRDEGALPARSFAGRNETGEMWGWKPDKRALEQLFAAGELAIARRDGFQRVYDLAERVIPRELLEAPVPDEPTFVREYTMRAIEGRGALTPYGVVEHCRLKGRQAQVRVALEELVAEGRVRRFAIDDGGEDVFVPADAQIADANPTAAVLLCPFENLLWDRRFAPRLFGFEHIIEVYKPEPIRQYGYYVLPLLVRDKIVARVDLRRDRKNDRLDVRAIHREPGQRDSKAFRAALDRALARVAGAAGVTP